MKNERYIVGIDEVGRGPLAGPVTVCACAVPHDFDVSRFAGIKDSKKLSPKKREKWFLALSEMRARGELDFAFTSVSAGEIDVMGIAPAIQKSLDASLEALHLACEEAGVFLDGSLKAPKKFVYQQTIIKGDEKVPIIGAASIIAKVMRDKYMDEQAEVYPQYGFEKHKGYGTSIHIEAIKKHGASILHRKSFLKNIL